MGRVHEASLPFVVWGCDLTRPSVMPDAVIEECTVDFDYQIFDNVLLKPCGFKSERIVYCPTDEGLSARRKRGIMLSRIQGSMQIMIPSR